MVGEVGEQDNVGHTSGFPLGACQGRTKLLRIQKALALPPSHPLQPQPGSMRYP